MKFKINQIQKPQKQDLSYTFGKMEEADVYFTEKFTDFRDFSKTEPHHLDLGFNIFRENELSGDYQSQDDFGEGLTPVKSRKRTFQRRLQFENSSSAEDFQNMAKTFKRLKSQEDEDCLSPDSIEFHSKDDKADFTNVLSKCCMKFGGNPSMKFEENKFLNTKNSTADIFESLNNPSGQLQGYDDDDFGFQIKSGLSKLKTVNTSNPCCSEVEDLGASKIPQVKASSDLLSTLAKTIGTYLVSRLKACKRFLGDFQIKELEMPLPESMISNSEAKKCPGKFHLICENKVDRNTYSVTVIDSENYEGDYKKDIYHLSSIRNGNPHILKYFGCWKEQGLVFIQTEQYTQTLEKLLLSGTIEPSERQKVVVDIYNAIEYCHSKGIVDIQISKSSIFLSNGNYKLNTLEFSQTDSPTSAQKDPETLLWIKQFVELFNIAEVDFPQKSLFSRVF
ncbi:unnamed protein product [Moneuplotes crassus]|uniref:Protein kinase domain-containing protein n=1 Tax=Euplotes crassus TaxID=5936 RepID=A0AAD1Y8V2_EUPCR|nr:unnamed protein product [Moneuplotes crassus]